MPMSQPPATAGPREISTAIIRDRFQRTSPAVDPTAVELGGASRDWPTGLQRRLTANLKPAGVLIPIFERAAGLSVLLTRRSHELKHHPGQVSFPGGRMEPGDSTIRHTALRETHEEVGIHPAAVEIVGFMEAMPTITGYAVTPVVGLLDGNPRLTLDPMEVELAFEVPLPFLLDPANETWSERDIDGVPVPIVEFQYGGQRIWGATASMIVAFRSYFEI